MDMMRVGIYYNPSLLVFLEMVAGCNKTGKDEMSVRCKKCRYLKHCYSYHSLTLPLGPVEKMTNSKLSRGHFNS